MDETMRKVLSLARQSAQGDLEASRELRENYADVIKQIVDDIKREANDPVKQAIVARLLQPEIDNDFVLGAILDMDAEDYYNAVKARMMEPIVIPPPPQAGAGDEQERPNADDTDKADPMSLLPPEVKGNQVLCDILRRRRSLWITSHKQKTKKRRGGPKRKDGLTDAQRWAVRVEWDERAPDDQRSIERFLEDVFGAYPNSDLIVMPKEFYKWKEPK